MSRADELCALFEATGCRVERSQIQNAERLDVHLGASHALVDVFQTGTLRPGGKEGPALEHVKGIVEEYQSDPGFLKATLAAASPEESIPRSVDYSAVLLVLDASRHEGAFATVVSMGLAKTEGPTLQAAEVSVRPTADRLVVQGAAEPPRVSRRLGHMSPAGRLALRPGERLDASEAPAPAAPGDSDEAGSHPAAENSENGHAAGASGPGDVRGSVLVGHPQRGTASAEAHGH